MIFASNPTPPKRRYFLKASLDGIWGNTLDMRRGRRRKLERLIAGFNFPHTTPNGAALLADHKQGGERMEKKREKIGQVKVGPLLLLACVGKGKEGGGLSPPPPLFFHSLPFLLLRSICLPPSSFATSSLSSHTPTYLSFADKSPREKNDWVTRDIRKNNNPSMCGKWT